MNLQQQIAQHFRDFHFGPNTTGSNLKEVLNGVDWKMATTKVQSLNDIAHLVFHINYYIAGVLQVLKGGTLDIRDRYSYDCPPINSADDWQQLLNKTFTEAELFAEAIEQLPESILFEDFTNPNYGHYYRNLHGLIEHSHYHLGQIAIIKKLISIEN